MHLHIEGSHDAWNVADHAGFVVHPEPFQTEREAMIYMAWVIDEYENIMARQEEY